MYYYVYLYKDSFTRYSYLNDLLLTILKFCFIYSFFFYLSEKRISFQLLILLLRKSYKIYNIIKVAFLKEDV